MSNYKCILKKNRGSTDNVNIDVQSVQRILSECVSVFLFKFLLYIRLNILLLVNLTKLTIALTYYGLSLISTDTSYTIQYVLKISPSELPKLNKIHPQGVLLYLWYSRKSCTISNAFHIAML